MNASVATDKFKSILNDILTNTTLHLGKVLMKFIINCVLAIVSIRGRVNFLQLMRYSKLNEKTFRNNFSKKVDWIALNSGIARKELPNAKHRVIAIDPAHIGKSGKCTPGIGKFWSGVMGQAKKGLEIMAIAAIDYVTKSVFMLGAVQSLPIVNGIKRSMIDCYIDAIKNCKDELQKLANIMVADAFFARKPFVDAIVNMAFAFVSRLQSNCVLKYIPTSQWLRKRGIKRGKHPKYAGKVDLTNPDTEFLTRVEIPSAQRAWSGIVWSQALKREIRIVIVKWGKTGTVVYFSTDVNMKAEDIVAIYQSRFQIEFGIRDSRQFTGLHHSQARNEARLDFAFNVSFFTKNVMQTEVDRYYPGISVGQLKKAISETEFAFRILKIVAPNGVNEMILNKIDHMIASYVGAVA